MRAFVFPGQGAQAIGMGKALADAYPAAKAVFDEVDDALGENFSALIFSGSEDDLKLTENTQPALMAVSLAVVRALEADLGIALKDHGGFVAGHSLGEYSALAAVGALSIADTAKLLRLRGRAMQSAVPVGEGAMAAVLGLDDEAGQDEIKTRYKELVKRLHPDANGGDRSNEDRLREIINAYNVLRSFRAV